MKNTNIKNLKIKRKYYKYLTGCEGLSEASINKIESSLAKYEEFTKNEDYGRYNSDKAINYKKWLAVSKFTGKALSVASYHNYLRSLRKFFTWLSSQPGYKRKFIITEINYLKTLKSEDRIALQESFKEYPSLNEVLDLTKSIEIQNEVDLRDRAIISFAALTGMRDSAIASLPLGCIDQKNLIVYQDPKKGVKTKFSKYIVSKIFNFDDELLQFFKEWLTFLKDKNFSAKDPLFPRSKIKKIGNDLCFQKADAIEPIFWQGAGRLRDIFQSRALAAGMKYYHPHTFRALAIDLAITGCKDGRDLKAVSQNFGHENVLTTLGSYAAYNPKRLMEVLDKIDFNLKEEEPDEELVEKIKQLIKYKN